MDELLFLPKRINPTESKGGFLQGEANRSAHYSCLAQV